MEKPAGISSCELRELADLAQSRDVRCALASIIDFIPSSKVASLVDNNTIGPLMFIRARYGTAGVWVTTGSGVRTQNYPEAAN